MQTGAVTNALLERAAQSERQGDLQHALALYRQVLFSDPRNFTALVNLGIAATRSGHDAEAQGLLEAALVTRPQSVETWVALGNSHARSGAYGRAVQAFTRAAALRPDLAAIHLNLGNALRRCGRIDEALASLELGVSLQPDFALGHFNLGMALADAGENERACAEYARSLELDPGHAAARVNLGNLQLRMNRADDARICFEQVLKDSPEFPNARYNFGVALQSLGRNREAARVFGEVLKREPSRLDARNNLIVSLIRDGQSAAALEETSAYLQKSAGNPKALAYQAAALLELGRREEAAVLLDYAHLVEEREVTTPPEFASRTAFNTALAAQVLAHDTLTHEPVDKATRGGSQTAEFTYGLGGAAAALREQIVAHVRTYMDRMRAALPEHPFVHGLPERWRLATWAVALQSQGYQGPHFHPDGRVSGVYYAAIPPGVSTQAFGAGCLEFGRTNEAIGGSAEPLLRVVAPRGGLMVLFPSYFYHRTIPFEAAHPRISIAFDVLPEP